MLVHVYVHEVSKERNYSGHQLLSLYYAMIMRWLITWVHRLGAASTVLLLTFF